LKPYSLGKKPISISPRYRWHTAISKVIMQLAVEDTKGVLFRQHTEDKNKSISITDQLNKSYLIFDGQKFYWRTKFSIHLQIILHEYDQTVNTARDNDGRKNAKAEAAKDNKGMFIIFIWSVIHIHIHPTRDFLSLVFADLVLKEWGVDCTRIAVSLLVVHCDNLSLHMIQELFLSWKSLLTTMKK
jgi:hypothetical protein